MYDDTENLLLFGIRQFLQYMAYSAYHITDALALYHK